MAGNGPRLGAGAYSVNLTVCTSELRLKIGILLYSTQQALAISLCYGSVAEIFPVKAAIDGRLALNFVIHPDLGLCVMRQAGLFPSTKAGAG